MIDELKELAADDCQQYAPTPAATLPPTVASDQVAATKVPYTTMYDGLCATKSFTHKTVAIFQGRAFDIVDRDNALRTFTDLAAQINQRGKKLLRSQGKCNLEGQFYFLAFILDGETYTIKVPSFVTCYFSW